MEKSVCQSHFSIFGTLPKIYYGSLMISKAEILPSSQKIFEFNVIPLRHPSDLQKWKYELCTTALILEFTKLDTNRDKERGREEGRMKTGRKGERKREEMRKKEGDSRLWRHQGLWDLEIFWIRPNIGTWKVRREGKQQRDKNREDSQD